MADNFDMKKFLVENKLGAYSKLRENPEQQYYVHDEEGLEEPIGPFSLEQAKAEVIKQGAGWKMIDAETAKEIWSHLDEGKENISIELYQGTVLTGPKEKEAEAKKLASEIEKAMKSAFNAAKGAGSESAAMDERDDTVYEFEDELSKLGFKIGEEIEEGEAAYEYEKGKAAGEKEEKEKLAKEDLESDLRGDLEKVSGLGPILDPSKLNALVKRLATMAQDRDYIRDDRMEFARVAKMLMSNKLADAAKYIIQLETSPREIVYEEIEQIYPELWDMLYDNSDGYISLSKPKKGLPEDLDKDRTDAEAEKMMDFLAEYEVIYVVQNGKCYRKDDEGNMDQVDMSKCRQYAESKEELKEFDEPIMQLINDPETLKTFLMSAAKLGSIGVGIAGLLKAYAKYVASKLKKDPKFADKSSEELEKMAGQALTGKVQASAGGTGGGFLAENDDYLPPSATERMDGLVPQMALKALIGGAQAIIRDFKEDGFEDEEIYDYIMSKIKTLG